MLRYREFLDNSLLGSAPVGHALLKAFESDGIVTYEDAEQQRLKLYGESLGQRMTSRLNTWAIGKWKVHSSFFEDDMKEAGRLLHAACADPDLELPKFPIRHLRNILRSGKSRTGLGVDLWVTKLWADLPDDALKILLSLIYLVQQGVMPMQLMVVLVSLIPKAGGGERPVALTAMLYRLVMRLNICYISEWDEAKAGFWDTALRGSSCLRAALARALQMEVATAQGFAAAGILWDLASFFDSIRIHELIRVALDKCLPPWVLSLSMQVHTGLRAFMEGTYVSEFVRPKGLSILAGCGGALSYTRCALYEVMNFMHSKYLPRCNIQSYVDDTPQTHTGPKEIVLLEAVNQAVDFVQQ